MSRTFWQKKLFVFLLGVAVFLVGMGEVEVNKVQAAQLNALNQGDIIQIAPQPGTYMCSDQDCGYEAGAAEPYKLMYTGQTASGSAYFVMVDNYCAWRSADCKEAYDGSSIERWFGTSFNSNGADIVNHNDLGGDRQSQNILIQLDNFYDSLPDQIGSLDKALAIPTKTFDLAAITSTAGTGTTTTGTCRTTTNATPYGSIGATFDGSACSMTSRVSLLSYEEWQGGLYAVGHYPAAGSIGNSFCQARFGTDCTNAGTYGLFYWAGTAKSPYYPWLRSPDASGTDGVWGVHGNNSTNSVIDHHYAYEALGVSPALWLSTNLCTGNAGDGSYATPYDLVNCNIAPSDLAFLTTGHQTVRANSTVTIMGQVTDEDMGEGGQEITVSATINGVEKIATTSAGLNRRWALTWDVGTELGNNNQTGPFTFTATDGVQTVSADWTWNILVDTSTLESGFYLVNPYQNQLAIDQTIIQLIGRVTDSDQAASISATIGGVSKSYTVHPGSNQEGWVLTWQGTELTNGKYGGIETPIMVTTTGTNANEVATYSGVITVGPPELSADVEEIIEIINQMVAVRFAGTLFFPAGTTPNSSPQSQGFAFSSYANNNPNYQIWTKNISGTTYPFLIRFFTATDPATGDITADTAIVQ